MCDVLYLSCGWGGEVELVVVQLPAVDEDCVFLWRGQGDGAGVYS